MSLSTKAACTYIVFFLLSFSAHAQQLKAEFTPSKTSDCESLITKFTDNSTGNPVSWQWDLGNGSTSTQQSPSASYTAAGAYKVTLTVKNAAGNTSTVEKTVTVWEKPKPDFTAGPAKGCVPFNVTFTDKSNPVNGTITTYSWDFGDGTTGSGSSPVHTYNNALSPTVTLTVTNSNGCTASKQISNIVEVGASLVANFNVSDKFLCTAPGALTITNATTGPGNLTYQWDFGDGGTTTEASPAPHNYTTRGVYKVKLTVTSDKGCTATKTSEDINVANFKTDFQLPASICENSTGTIFNASNSPQANSLTWSVDKGYFNYYSGTTASYYPNGAGTVKVTMTADYGKCRESVTKDFEVKVAPKADFSTDQTAICDVPATVKLTDKSQGATSWSWSFGNGQSSTQQNPSVTYNNLGYFIINLTASNAVGCSASTLRYVNVAKPEVYAYASISDGCEGLTPTFNANISTGDAIATYEWDFGDGSAKSADARPSHTYTKEGSYQVRLTYTTTNGCKGTVNLYSHSYIRVYKKPKPDFSSPQAPQICGNNWVYFNGTTDVGNSWSWSFGDGYGDHSQNVSHSYRAPGTYTVSLIVSNNSCSETITKTAYIKAVNPFPRFTMQPVKCENRTEMTFNEQSIGTITSWKWNWGDGKEDSYTTKTTPAKHKYDKTGVYKVKLTVTDGTCTSSDSLTINIYAPSPVTVTTDKTSLCGNETIRGTIVSAERSIYGSFAYSWRSTDGTPSNWYDYNYESATFTNLKPGKDSIYMIAFNYQGCPDTSNKVPINVHGPIAKFLSPSIKECRGTELTFTDQTDISKGKPIKTWSWDFGDGGPAKVFTAPPFKYTYNKSGYFYPRLTVTDQDGCISSFNGDYIQVNGPNADFSPSTSLIPPGGNIWFYNYTSVTGGNATYKWDFGDNTSSTQNSPSKTYPDKGVYTVKLVAKDNNGCTDSAKKQIKVSSVSASFTFTTSFVNNSGCPPVIARFTNTSVNASSYYWDFGDGSFATISSPSHTYTYAGKYKVKLKVVGDADTEDEYEAEVEVKGPYATITTSTNGGCLTKEIEFQVSAVNAVDFAWDFTDGNVETTTASTIKHTFKDPGIYKPRLILSDQAGCKGTAFLDHPIVIDKLDVQLTATPEFVCDEGWITFAPKFNSYSIDELKEEAEYKWTFDAGLQVENDATATPRFLLDKIQEYNFSLTTTTAYGCTQTVSKKIYAYPKPVAAITAPAQACQDEPVSFSGAVTKVNDVTWKWNFGNGSTSNIQQPVNQAYSTAGPSEVALLVTSKDGCADTATHNISIQPKPVINATAASAVICQGKSTTLSAGGGITYQWSPVMGLSNPQAPDPVADPRVSTTYQVSVTDANGCSNKDEVSIRVAEPFRVQATPDTVMCLGYILPLWVRGADHYVWTGEGLDADNIPAPHATIKAAGDYTYTVTGYDADGCFTHDTSLVVSVHPAPTVSAGPDRVRMTGMPVPLYGQGSPDIIKWTWMPPDNLDCINCPRPMASPNLSTRYTLQVENGYGCKATDEVLVMVTCDRGAVFLPTGFTPNRDGVNERFYPKGRGIKEVASLKIFDRWGSLVFERSHFQMNIPGAGWDGMWKGAIAPMGTYIYAIETICEDGTKFLFRGTVMLIK